MALLRGRVVTARADLADHVLDVDGDTIRNVRSARPDDPAHMGVLVPGLIDLHCHGGGGASFTDGDAEAVHAAAAHHLAWGTTSLMGSAMTDSPQRMLAVMHTLADAADAGELVGIHLEGPFLSAARCGAQDPAHLRDPDPVLTRELVAAGRGHLRVMTVAPELPGADAVLDELASAGVVAAVGHTTASSACVRAVLARAEAGLVTHLFNGMTPIHHRDPGAALAALAAASRGDVVVELVADGVHLDDETVASVLALAPGQVALVTDAMAAAGMPDGSYRLGPQAVRVVAGVARLAEGDSIAGGTARLSDVVRRQVRAGLPPSDVVGAATHTPARLLGLVDRGLLRAGERADVVVLDDDWQVARVMQAGEWVR